MRSSNSIQEPQFGQAKTRIPPTLAALEGPSAPSRSRPPRQCERRAAAPVRLRRFPMVQTAPPEHGRLSLAAKLVLFVLLPLVFVVAVGAAVVAAVPVFAGTPV